MYICTATQQVNLKYMYSMQLGTCCKFLVHSACISLYRIVWWLLCHQHRIQQHVVISTCTLYAKISDLRDSSACNQQRSTQMGIFRRNNKNCFWFAFDTIMSVNFANTILYPRINIFISNIDVTIKFSFPFIWDFERFKTSYTEPVFRQITQISWQ